MRRKLKNRWPVLYAVLLAAFTVYTLLDTFVIPRTYSAVTEAVEPEPETFGTLEADAAASAGSGSAEDSSDSAVDSSGSTEDTDDTVFTDQVVMTDSSYSDENIAVTITEYREYDTTIYVADVQVSSPEYLRTALAEGVYGRNVTEKTSEMAEDNGAVLAINGDYYGAQTEGYVIRNGVLYRSEAAGSQEDLVIWADGTFEIVSESEVTAEALLENGAQQVLSFGPALVTGGEIAVTEEDEVGKAKASNPRTAIGILDACHYLFVVADGRTDESQGLSLYELAEVMQGLGADIAYNLDGGGSSTMVFCGQVVNNPTSSGRSIKERSVSDIVYIG